MTAVVTIMIATVAGFLAAVAIVVILLYFVSVLMDGKPGRHRAVRLQDEVDAQYRAARRAMNNAANQSWRNLID